MKRMWLPLMLLAVVAVVFPACETNDPDEYPNGVITLKMRNDRGTYLYLDYKNGDGGPSIYIDEANNFKGSAGFCDVGRKKLNSVKSVPTNGWAGSVAVTPGHSYVIRFGYEDSQYSPLTYYKLYVVDYIESTGGGIIGAEVKYCQWNP